MELKVRTRTVLIDDEDWPRLNNLLQTGRRLLDMDSTKPGSPPGSSIYAAIYKGWNYETLLGRWIVGAPPDLVVDYVNHDTLDNRKENLRLCSRDQDRSNRVKNQRSEFKGAQLGANGKWRARITVNGKKHSIGGTFDTAEAAARAYDRAARRYFGEFAKLNFPNDIGDRCYFDCGQVLTTKYDRATIAGWTWFTGNLPETRHFCPACREARAQEIAAMMSDAGITAS